MNQRSEAWKVAVTEAAATAFDRKASELTANMIAAIDQVADRLTRELHAKTVRQMRKDYFLVRKSWRANALAIVTVLAALVTAYSGIKLQTAEEAKTAVSARIAKLSADGAVKRIEDADRLLRTGSPAALLAELHQDLKDVAYATGRGNYELVELYRGNRTKGDRFGAYMQDAYDQGQNAIVISRRLDSIAAPAQPMQR